MELTVCRRFERLKQQGAYASFCPLVKSINFVDRERIRMPRRGQYIAHSESERPNHFYPTPTETIPGLLSCGGVAFILAKPFVRILDPGAGDGAWGRVIKQANPSAYIVGVEKYDYAVVPDCYDEWYKEDFVTEYRPDKPFDLIVGNPPFKLATEFICKAYSILSHGGLLSFLLRLAFLETQKRQVGIFSNMPPRFVYVSSKRVPFKPKVGKPRTTVAYAQYIWQRDYNVSDIVLRHFNWQTYLETWQRSYGEIPPNYNLHSED